MTDVSRFRESGTLKNGRAVTIRAVRPDDKPLIAAAFSELERESRYSRFFGYKDDLSEEELRRVTEPDFETEVGLVATTTEGGEEIIVAGGRYVLLGPSSGAPPRAEFACTVEEDFQGQGLAGLLFEHLAGIARSKGVAALEAVVQPSNPAMLAVFARTGLPMTRKHGEGLIHVSLALE